MKKWMSLLMVSLLLIGVIGCSSESDKTDIAKESGDETINLTYAFFTTENTFLGQMVKYWAEEVEKRTEGKVKVDVHYGGTLLDAANMYDGVKNDVADIGITVLQYEPGKYPLVEIGEITQGYENGAVASQVTSDLIAEYPPEALKEFKILKAFSNDVNRMFTNKKVEKVEEINGLQLRVAGGFIGLIEEFGAAGLGMSQAEQAEALQTGVIDGTVTERALLKDAQLAELVDYLIEMPLYSSSYAAVMKQDKWDALPEDVKKVMEELHDEIPKYAGEYLDNRTQDNIEWAKEEYGLKVIELDEVEKEKWNKIMNEYRDKRIKALEAEGLPAQEYADRVDELIEKYSN